MKNFLFLAIFIAACFLVVIAMRNPTTPAAAAATVSATTTLPPANPTQAAKCEKVLDYGRHIGAIKSYQGTTDGYGTVVVGPSFYSATFENKQSLDAMVRCVLSQGRADYSGLQYVGYYDPYTNKEIARWSHVTGFAVD